MDRQIDNEKKHALEASYLPDEYADKRGSQYKEIKNSACHEYAKEIDEQQKKYICGERIIIAINTAIYDIHGDLVLYQTRRHYKDESKRYAKNKIRYRLARFENGRIVEDRALEVRGQTIHYFIRIGKSPIAALREEKAL